MGDEGKSERLKRQPVTGPGEHFATRRKILGGLAGVPVFLTFGNRANAAAESFGRCIENSLGTADLSPPGVDGYYIDQNNNLYVGAACDTEPAFTSVNDECVASFMAGAVENGREDLLPKGGCDSN